MNSWFGFFRPHPEVRQSTSIRSSRLRRLFWTFCHVLVSMRTCAAGSPLHFRLYGPDCQSYWLPFLTGRVLAVPTVLDKPNAPPYWKSCQPVLLALWGGSGRSPWLIGLSCLFSRRPAASIEGIRFPLDSSRTTRFLYGATPVMCELGCFGNFLPFIISSMSFVLDSCSTVSFILFYPIFSFPPDSLLPSPVAVYSPARPTSSSCFFCLP